MEPPQEFLLGLRAACHVPIDRRGEPDEAMQFWALLFLLLTVFSGVFVQQTVCW
jgi:hypothetical protein